MAEFYRDEHPVDLPFGEWKDEGRGGGDGSGGGDGGGYIPLGSMGVWYVGGTPAGAPGQVVLEQWHLLGAWQMDFSLLLTDSSGRLLCDKNDLLLFSSKGCLTIKIECQIKGDPEGKHAACVLIAIDAVENNNMEVGILENMLLNGCLSVTAKWQKGHYDIAAVHTARFRLNESEITPWIKIPLDETPCEIMQIKIVDGQLRLVRANKR